MDFFEGGGGARRGRPYVDPPLSLSDGINYRSILLCSTVWCVTTRLEKYTVYRGFV